MNTRRVVITGLGLISPVGNTPDLFFENLLNGHSGVRKRRRNAVAGLDTAIAAEADFDPLAYFPKKRIATLDRFAQMGLAAAGDAIRDAHLVAMPYDASRAGVYWGTGLGGTETFDSCNYALYHDNATRLNPFTVVRVMNNSAGSNVALDYGLRGPCLTFSNACASSAVAIGEAFRAIRFGVADAVVAGGSEALLSYPVIKAWEALHTLAEEDREDCSRSCRPFSLDRTGFVLGEGAACVVLEERSAALKRGARIYAEVLSYGSTCDASHMTMPDAKGQASAMRIALQEAGIDTDAVDYINAHGTATIAGDNSETAAIKDVFGQHAYRLAVSSTKSMHGHMMGATGAVELVATVLAIHHQAIPPTAHLSKPDPACDLDYVPNLGRRNQRVRHAMTNSFAFGGTNAVLFLGGG